MMPGLDDIRAAVESGSKKFLDTFKEAVSIPSVSAEGQALDEMASWLETHLKALGAEVSRLEVPGGPATLLGILPGTGDRTVLIYDHYDVQPVDPIGLWESDPFEPTERDGRIFGRGSVDNKGDLMARLAAIEVYRELFGDFPYTIKFCIEGEEETGSPHFEEICQKYSAALAADNCVWEGGWYDTHDRPTIYYGCKGLLYVELWSKMLSGDQHSSVATYAPSAAWRLLRAIGSMKDDAGRIVIEGFHDDCVTAQRREQELIDAIPFDEEAHLQLLGVESFDRGLRGVEVVRELVAAPTANIAGFHSGYGVPGAAKTVLPAQAMAKMDFRLVPDQNVDDVAAKVQAHLAKHGFDDITMTVLGRENPSRSPLDTPLGKAIEGAAARWFSTEAVILPWMWGTGPMYPIAQGLGIPICSPAGTARPDSNLHAPNEGVRVQDFLDIAGYTVAYLKAYGEN